MLLQVHVASCKSLMLCYRSNRCMFHKCRNIIPWGIYNMYINFGMAVSVGVYCVPDNEHADYYGYIYRLCMHGAASVKPLA